MTTHKNGMPGLRDLLTGPMAVVRDPVMTIDEKRALLASWASDRRTVQNDPALRRLDDGRVVRIDDVLDALKRLDQSQEHEILPVRRKRLDGRGYWPTSRHWGRRDDDDDDPPTPAAAAGRPRAPVLEGGMAVAA